MTKNIHDLKVPIKAGTKFTIEGRYIEYSWLSWINPFNWKRNREKTLQEFAVAYDVDKEWALITYYD